VLQPACMEGKLEHVIRHIKGAHLPRAQRRHGVYVGPAGPEGCLDRTWPVSVTRVAATAKEIPSWGGWSPRRPPSPRFPGCLPIHEHIPHCEVVVRGGQAHGHALGRRAARAQIREVLSLDPPILAANPRRGRGHMPDRGFPKEAP
jgi:hypothetical protein